MYPRSLFFLLYPVRWGREGGKNRGCINLSSCRVNCVMSCTCRQGGAQKESDKVQWREMGRWGKKMERGQGRRGGDERRRKSGVKGGVREGGQRQKWERGGEAGWSEAKVYPSLFPFTSPPLSLSPITLTGLVIGRGPVSLSFLFLFLCLSLPRGSAPQREPWGPEIADDKIAAAFHSAEGYPTLPWQLKRGSI